MFKKELIDDSGIELLNTNSHDDEWWSVYGIPSEQIKGFALESYKDTAKKLTDYTLRKFLKTSKNKESDVYKIFLDELASRK